MTITTNTIKNWILFIALALFTWSCVDQEFDEPPVPGLVDIEANTTIAELKALHTIGDDDSEITQEIIIGGVVVADDRSGNFFKNIVLQDASGGITLRLNATSLYNDYPIGRKVFVSCKGLYIGDFNGLIQLNGSPDAAIEEVLIRDFVFRGERDQVVEPNIISIADLDASHINTLVMIPDVQFLPADTAVTYADAANRISVNLNLQDCNGDNIILRSSGFADFANELTPGQNGSITAIYSVFGNDKQLLIRDLNDVFFEANRCGVDPGNNSANVEYIALETIRADYENGMTSIQANKKVSGIVVSDRQNGNTASQNLVLQDGGRGIIIRFREDHSFDLGNEVEIIVSGKPLAEFNGQLQVSDLNLEAVTVLGTNNVPEPKEVSIQEILNNAEAWESTEVKIANVRFTGSNTYEGPLTITDSTGTITMFTRSAASFANTAIPNGKLDLTAVISQFNSNYQLFIRNLDDVGEVTGPVVEGSKTAINESFSSLTDGTDINLDGWVNVAVKGTRLWRAEEFSGNIFAQATAFQDSNAEMEAWLVTPVFSADTANVLSFRSAQAFHVHDGLTVLISSDFDGSDVSAANWEPLQVRLANSSDDRYEWISSGEVDLSGFEGQVRVAFRYIGNPNDGTTTYRIDDVKIE